MATEPKRVRVELELPEHQAYALAELCKRIGWQTCRRLAVSDSETQGMIDATSKLGRALDDAGVVVR